MKISRTVSVWLFIGVVMLFVQVVLGGITRITGSGLSITKWDIITGTIPPLTINDWRSAFELYKETPQYHKINGGMELSEFKFIYFWEFIHRLWARIMGFVFLFPFIYFLFHKMLSPVLIKRLVIVVLLSAFTAVFGWIMVASGLMDRPWVSAYKLGFHLLLAFITYVYLLWTYFIATYTKGSIVITQKSYRIFSSYIVILWVQILLGGFVSGMKAGLFYNTWPTMGGGYIPDVLYDVDKWTWLNMTLYDADIFAPSLIQFLHRNTAYIICILAIWIFVMLRSFYHKSSLLPKINHYFMGIITTQVLLGISVVIFAVGEIPLIYGVLHQIVAFILLGVSYFMLYSFSTIR